ncbi:helix-turn-helix transcriptional regulator [Pseudomonas sp. ITA]|nr:helix-turn-helix transcriptional regulator [Pseudomonas sp. ITA]
MPHARKVFSATALVVTRLERDGLLARHESGEIPPRVEYELTPLGMGLLIRMSPMRTWVVEHVEDFRKTRRTFDSRGGKKPSWQIPTAIPADSDASQ